MTRTLPAPYLEHVLRPLVPGVLIAGLLASGCAEGPRRPSRERVEVPKLVGMENRPAQELLARKGFRWTYSGADRVWADPPPPNQWSTGDDHYVVDQSPAPGMSIERGGVVRLHTSCSMDPLPPGAVCID